MKERPQLMGLVLLINCIINLLLQKKAYLLKEHPDNLPLMKSIKRSLDPNNIMNPGKIFDLN